MSLLDSANSKANAAFPANLTVLLVDDEAIFRKGASRVMQFFGARVLVAASGQEAVELFQQHAQEVGLLLCDIVMPDMDGWQTMAAIRKLAPNLPVILSSGFFREIPRASTFPPPPPLFLAKPYEPEQLRQAILRALGSAKA